VLSHLIAEARFLIERTRMFAAVAVEKDGQILMLRRGKTAPWMPGKWNLPGGEVEEGETPQQAAAREAREEASIQVGSMKLLKKVPMKGMGDVYFFHSTKFSGKPKFNWESDAMQWTPVEAAVRMPLVPGVKSALVKLVKNPVSEELLSLMERGKKRVSIFDFDGTLFKSPQRPSWWKDAKWWHSPASLNPPCVPERPDASWWNKPLVGIAKKRISDPDTHTVLLTGRWSSIFTPRVRKLLGQVGLNFDEVLLSTHSKTLPFKTRVLKDLLDRGELESIEVWDDHPTYTRAFQSLFDKAGVRFSIKNAKTLSHKPACQADQV
jgi:8-oxo-dGTP diphosphatase